MQRLSGPAQADAPEEDGPGGRGSDPRLPGALSVSGPAVHRGGPEGAVQTRPPQHARLRQEEEARTTGRPLQCSG